MSRAMYVHLNLYMDILPIKKTTLDIILATPLSGDYKKNIW